MLSLQIVSLLRREPTRHKYLCLGGCQILQSGTGLVLIESWEQILAQRLVSFGRVLPQTNPGIPGREPLLYEQVGSLLVCWKRSWVGEQWV